MRKKGGCGVEEDREAFFARLQMLAAANLPEWKYAPDSGEPASALLQACGELLFDSRTRVGRLLKKHEIEFLNCLDPVRREAEPPGCWLGFRALPGAPETLIQKGTRLYAAVGEGIRPFTLRHSLCVSAVAVKAMYFSSARRQKLICVPLPKTGTERMDLPLFDFSGKCEWENVVRFFHPFLFSSKAGAALTLRLEAADETGAQRLPSVLADPSLVRWSLEGEAGERPLDMPSLSPEGLVFRLPPMEAGCLVLRGIPGALLPEYAVRGLAFSTGRGPLPAGRVLTGKGTEDPEEFLPFGEEPGPYMECLLASDEVLCQRGAEVELRFHLSFRETARELPLAREEPQEYRYVMRRPRPQPKLTVHQVHADEVRVEYFDGEQWAPLPCREVPGLFCPAEEGEAERVLRFSCPADLSVCAAGGEERHWLRFRLLRAENSGWLPCVYHAPVIRHLRFSCAYRAPCPPERVERRVGFQGESLTPESLLKGVPLFGRIRGSHDEWYLGLDRRPGNPFRMFLELETRERGGCTFSYSRKDGSFALAEVRDGTDGLSHSGGLAMTVSEDFGPAELFGETLWWLRIGETGGEAERARLRGLYLNSVSAEAAGEWSGGTIPPGERFHFLDASYPVAARSVTASYGGSPPESREEARIRALGELRCQGRAVTEGDLERLLGGAFREIDKVRCIVDRPARTVRAAVLMRDFESPAFEGRRAALDKLVAESSGLSGLGLDFELRTPEFVTVRVSAWLRAFGEGGAAELELEAAAALERFLHPVTGGFDGRGWPIGTLPNRDQLRACLRLLDRPFSIEELLVTRYCPEDGTEQELAGFRDRPFAVPVSGPHVIQAL